MHIYAIHAIHSIHAIHADTFRYIHMLMIHAHTYIIHATYMLYIQIHTHIYTSLPHCDVAVVLRRRSEFYHMCMYVYVLHVCNVIHADTYQYIHIHTHTYTCMQWLGQAHLTHVRHAACRYTLDTCTYMHIYTHIHTDTYTYIHIQSVSWRGFGVLLLPHATPMRSATYPDQLRRGSGRGHRVPIVIGWPMGCAGGQLWPPRRVQRARGRQNGCGNGSLIAG